MASTAGTQHRCVFVGNIPYDATEEQLVQICEEVGPVVNFRLVVDRETGKPKGYGFCEYKDEETALSARRNLQGYEINGRQLRVDFAENDKGTDRNREQGRGGPGLTSNLEFQKPLPGPPILGDSNLHQQIGLPSAATAASIMARVLSGAQSTSMPAFQNGLPSTSGLGNDPLTHYLSKMTRYQLTEVMSAVKTLATQNMPMAQQLLQGSPHLPKALFQAEILLGMVSPQMLQMASNQQSSSVSQPSLQDWVQDQKPVLPSHLGQMPSHKEVPGSTISRSLDDQVPSALPNSLVRQPSPLPFQNVPVQPPLQHPLPPQAQVHTHTQTMTPGTSGVLMIQTYQPQSLGGFSIQPHIPSLPTSKGLISQIQPPLLQHPRPTGVANTAHPHLVHPSANLQTSVLPHPPMAQAGLSNHLELDTFQNKAGISASAVHNLRWSSKTQMQSSLREQTGMTGDMSELTDHCSKRPRLEDVSEAPQLLTSGSAISKSFPVQSIPTGLSGSHTNYMQNSDKQISQLPPDVESALLQQVISLTPEQLSSLPLEQQQQVLQLQQMLR